MEKDSCHSNSAREQKASENIFHGEFQMFNENRKILKRGKLLKPRGIQNLEVNEESKAVAKRKISYCIYFSFIETLGMNLNHLYL